MDTNAHLLNGEVAAAIHNNIPGARKRPGVNDVAAQFNYFTWHIFPSLLFLSSNRTNWLKTQARHLAARWRASGGGSCSPQRAIWPSRRMTFRRMAGVYSTVKSRSA